ncbi:MAG: DUF402 domain-containing protein [Spirochaetales bacterium]|nr:DUF402 domain-containing protein [Spirochaetales bacterium]
MNTRYFLYKLHFPARVRVSEFGEESIRYSDETVLVYDFACYSLVLRHFVFYDKWFDIHCFLSSHGSLRTLPGPIDFCFVCDISTPVFKVKNKFYNIDLAYDILVGSDGKTHLIKDEDDFLRALTRHWITEDEKEGALKGLSEMTSIINNEGITSYCNAIVPFNGHAKGPESHKFYHLPLNDVAVLKKDRRQKYIFGKG